jgi:hypothetical protein
MLVDRCLRAFVFASTFSACATYRTETFRTGGHSGEGVAVTEQGSIDVSGMVAGDTVFFYRVANGMLQRGPRPSGSFCLEPQ